MTLYADAIKAWRFAASLREYWRVAPPGDDAADLVRAQVAAREATFLHTLHHAIYAHAHSPYLALLWAAGIAEADVAQMVAADGLEGALSQLYEAGVYVTLDEFKGHVPLRRGSLTLDTTAAAFDNPQSEGHLSATTGGSRSGGGRGGVTRLSVDVHGMRDELPSRRLHLQAHGLLGRPYAMWRPAPPALAGLRVLLQNGALGLPLERWFSHTPALRGAGKSVPLTLISAAGARLSGRGDAWPVHVPMDRANVVARWMAERTARGERVHLDTMVNAGARLCRAADDLGLDISGHTLRTTSEPLTEAKADLFGRHGLRVCSVYAMLEGGMLGYSCCNPAHADEMHLLDHRMAFVRQPRQFPGLEQPIDSLWLTVFSRANPKVMLNVETGDYATQSERACGCPLEEAGYHRRIHTIRSYEKLTSSGMSFMGSALLEVLEVALPARFGGGPEAYQFVEREVSGETVVCLVIDPAVGPLDDADVVAYALDQLSRRTRAGATQTQVWRDGGLLRVERARPYITAAAKVQALHVERTVHVERPVEIEYASPAER